jgi:hypothetical protein
MNSGMKYAIVNHIYKASKKISDSVIGTYKIRVNRSCALSSGIAHYKLNKKLN